MRVIYKSPGTIANEHLLYAIICAKYQGRWVFVQHQDRDTWELPAGHREETENINDTARRELYEETGALSFDIKPIYDYCVTGKNAGAGRLFLADIHSLGPLPDFEIARIRLFNDLPNNLTYPILQPRFFRAVLNTFKTIH